MYKRYFNFITDGYPKCDGLATNESSFSDLPFKSTKLNIQ